MTNTPHLGLTLVEQAQAQKEVTVNQALSRIDALLNTGAISRTLSTPPSSPSSGDVYVVGDSPAGAWSGRAMHIAYFDQVWRFIQPRAGMTLWVVEERFLLTFDGTSWVPSGGDSILGAPGMISVYTNDFVPVVRDGVLHLVRVSQLLAASSAPGGAGILDFSTAGNSGLLAGAV